MSRSFDWQYDYLDGTFRARFRLVDGTLLEMTIELEQFVAVRFSRFEIRTVSDEPVVLFYAGARVPDVEISDGEEEVPTTQPDAAPAEPAAGASAGPADETVPADITGMDRNVKQRTR